MSITITIEGRDAKHARREMEQLLGLVTPIKWPLESQAEVPPRILDGDVTANDAPAEDADEVEFPAATAEPPKKRGRPRKEPPVVDVEPKQLDIEDAIAGQANEPDPVDSEALAEHTALSADEIATTPQPEDPAAGWTIQDARNAGRALLDRAPDVETGNRKLAATLVPFGVQQVKALKDDQIEAFVVATTKAVF